MTSPQDGYPGQTPPQPSWAPPHVYAVAPPVFGPPATRPPRRVSIGAIVAIVLLALGLLGTAAFLVVSLWMLDSANSRIEDQQDRIDEQDDLIEKRETFGAAMNGLLGSAAELDGNLFADLVPVDDYQDIATNAWLNRWDLAAMDDDLAAVEEAAAELQAVRDAAGTQAATNASGSVYESVTDQLGGGFVASVVGDVDGFCEGDVLGCVSGADPFTIHYDAADAAVPYMTDWLETGIAYHEFAHVLQFTNPEPTETAVASFGGDVETMADCFALTYLSGWTLDHTVWTSSYQYWEVSLGYGYTCDEPQRQAIRDWYGQLGYTPVTITQ